MKDCKVFLTGATGLVGSSLIVDLVRQGCVGKFVCLVRSARDVTASERLLRAVREECVFEGREDLFSEAMGRVEAVEGDVSTLDDMALSKLPQMQGVSKILHCAADVNLGKDPTGRVFRTNFNGTKSVIELAKRMRASEFHYVATAYVAGKRNGVVYETRNTGEAGYNNAYEESKSKAEDLVRESGLPFAIYRPGIIVGRSSDGRIRRALAFYRILEFLVKFKAKMASAADANPREWVTMKINCAAKASQAVYFTPIDYVQKGIGYLFQHFKSGATYHLTGNSPISAEQILEQTSSVLHIRGIEIGASSMHGTPEERLFTKLIGDLFPYFSTDITFDQANISAAWPDSKEWTYGTKELDLMLRSYLRDHCSRTAWCAWLADNVVDVDG